MADLGNSIPDHPVPHAADPCRGGAGPPSATLLARSRRRPPSTYWTRSTDRSILILDGGPCPGGIESTVIDLTSFPSRVLRPGPIRPSELRDVIGEVIAAEIRSNDEATPLPSPGVRSAFDTTHPGNTGVFSETVEAARRVEELFRDGKTHLDGCGNRRVNRRPKCPTTQ